MKTLDDLIKEIAECLSEWGGEEIVNIANRVLTTEHRYIGDSLVEEICPNKDAGVQCDCDDCDDCDDTIGEGIRCNGG